MVLCIVNLYAQYGPYAKIIDYEDNAFDAEIVGFSHPSSKYTYEDHIVGYEEDGDGLNIYFRGNPTLVHVKKEPESISIGGEKALHYRLNYKGTERYIYIKARAILRYKDYIDNDEEKMIYFKDLYAVSIRY
jgi:hypothetical protein